MWAHTHATLIWRTAWHHFLKEPSPHLLKHIRRASLDLAICQSTPASWICLWLIPCLWEHWEPNTRPVACCLYFAPGVQRQRTWPLAQNVFQWRQDSMETHATSNHKVIRRDKQKDDYLVWFCVPCKEDLLNSRYFCVFSLAVHCLIYLSRLPKVPLWLWTAYQAFIIRHFLHSVSLPCLMDQ